MSTDCNKYRILFAWLGDSDLQAAKDIQGLGPIALALKLGNFKKVVLLATCPNPLAYVEWLVEEVGDIEIQISRCYLSSPNQHAEVYAAAKGVVEGVKLLHPGAQFVFHTVPGTSAMGSMWIRLRDLYYQDAELIQTSLERGLEVIDLPAIETSCHSEIKLWLGTGFIVGIYCEAKITY